MRCKDVLTAVLYIVYSQQYLHSVAQRVQSIVIVTVSYGKSSGRLVNAEASPRALLKASVSRVKTELPSPGTHSREREAQSRMCQWTVFPCYEINTTHCRHPCFCFFFLMWFVRGLINFVQQKDPTHSLIWPILGWLATWYWLNVTLSLGRSIQAIRFQTPEGWL